MNTKISLENLPQSFINNIVEFKEKYTLIWSNVFDLPSITKWMAEFSTNTNTKWNVHSSVPSGIYIQCKLVIFFYHRIIHEFI